MCHKDFSHLFQIRSRQFEKISSHWSSPVTVDFVVLPKPSPVKEITVMLDRVYVEYNEDSETMVKADVKVAWPSIVVEDPVMFKFYSLLVSGSEQETETVNTVSHELYTIIIALILS